MRTLTRLAIVITAAAAIAGCGTSGNTKTGEFSNNIPQMFYGQPNTASILSVEGATNGPGVCMTLSISNATKICLSTPIPAKQMLPRDPNWIESMGDVVKTVAPWVAVGYLGSHVSSTPATTVKGATTVTVPAVSTTPATP
jgi:hypothetical protein